jgi:hypothetical protein
LLVVSGFPNTYRVKLTAWMEADIQAVKNQSTTVNIRNSWITEVKPTSINDNRAF